jgi:hypothetical protein
MEAQNNIKRSEITTLFHQVEKIPTSSQVTSSAHRLQLCTSHSQPIITMFSKAVAFLLFAACAIAGSIPDGTYVITNVASQSTARVYNPGSEIYVSSTRENPGPFQMVSPSLGRFSSNILTICLKQQWNIKSAQNDGYTIENVALAQRFAAASVSV